MHGNCTASQNCDDENIGEQYNAGEVKIKGIELKAGYEFDFNDLSMPIDLTYTNTQTEFLNTFKSDFWGDVDDLDWDTYTFSDGDKSNKFWEYFVKEDKLLVRYGKIGSKGVLSQTSYSSEKEVEKEVEKLVASKKKKGYSK